MSLAQHNQLPWPRKLGYGTAELGLVSVEVLLEVYLLKFYHVVVGLPPAFTGVALAIAIAWDAISDPLMGKISDNTVHHAGRRRPYLLPGALALSIAFILIFNPPSMESYTLKFLYLLGSYLLLTTAMTVIGVPHVTLGGEMSFDRDERTEIFGYRRLFSSLGLLLGTMLPAIILSALQSEGPEAVARSRGLTSIILAAPILLTAWIAFRSTRGLDRPAISGTFSFLSTIDLRSLVRDQLSCLRNLVFLPLLLAFVIAGIGRAINASIALYYYEHRLHISESDAVFYILLPFFLCILASVPLWVYFSRRFGKKRPALSGLLGLGIFISVAYPVIPAQTLSWPFLVAIIGGFLAGSIIIYESLIADVVDVDELKKGVNREGLYFGLWKMTVKLSRALGLAVAGVLLQLIGFDESAAVQSKEVAFRIGILFGPGVSAFFVTAALVFLSFPLTDSRHRRIQRLLRKKRTLRGAGT